MDPLGCWHEDTAWRLFMRCQWQTWYTLVDSCLKCTGASAIWSVSHWLSSTLMFGHVARLDPGSSASTIYDPLRLMVDIAIWPAGEDHRAALATSGSTWSRRWITPYRYLRCGDLRSPWVHGAAQLRNDDDDDDDTCSETACNTTHSSGLGC